LKILGKFLEIVVPVLSRVLDMGHALGNWDMPFATVSMDGQALHAIWPAAQCLITHNARITVIAML
jgi:hypothetical protein